VPRTTWIVALLAASCAALLASGCGSSSDTSSAEEWANDLCGAFTTWEGAIRTSASDLQSNPSKDGLQTFADDADQATGDFVDELKGLGKPDTQGGEQAEQELDRLSSELDGELERIKESVEGVSDASEAVSAVSVVSGSLVTMANQVSSTIKQLQQADVDDELKQAFSSAESCQALQSS
jgi:hypothetical protein